MKICVIRLLHKFLNTWNLCHNSVTQISGKRRPVLSRQQIKQSAAAGTNRSDRTGRNTTGNTQMQKNAPGPVRISGRNRRSGKDRLTGRTIRAFPGADFFPAQISFQKRTGGRVIFPRKDGRSPDFCYLCLLLFLFPFVFISAAGGISACHSPLSSLNGTPFPFRTWRIVSAWTPKPTLRNWFSTTFMPLNSTSGWKPSGRCVVPT